MNLLNLFAVKEQSTLFEFRNDGKFELGNDVVLIIKIYSIGKL